MVPSTGPNDQWGSVHANYFGYKLVISQTEYFAAIQSGISAARPLFKSIMV
jgi:hypothetical protein